MFPAGTCETFTGTQLDVYSVLFLTVILFDFDDGAAQCVLGCSSPNILWRATLTQRINGGAYVEYVSALHDTLPSLFICLLVKP